MTRGSRCTSSQPESTSPEFASPDTGSERPDRAALGLAGETAAARYLERLGMRILDRRWRCARGELDLVADDRGTTVFVEVKTRRTSRFGHPFESITRQKVARLRLLASLWLGERGRRGAIRIDAVAVSVPPAGAWRIEHVRGVE